MAAYVIADVDVEQPEAYEEYRRQVGPTLEAYGGKFLVRGGRAEPLEGTWVPNRLVILEFETFERAKEWYSSQEYAGPKALRQSLSAGNLVVVEGIPSP